MSELDDELQLFLDRRRRRPGRCKFCGKPNADHRASIKDPANGCALAELLFEIAEVQAEHSRANGSLAQQHSQEDADQERDREKPDVHQDE
jgi:hypothetical protein